MKARFSLLNLLFATAFCAAMLVAHSFRRQFLEAQAKIESIQRELDQSRPISFGSIKHQIAMATQDIASSEVASVHYNSLRDRYTVQFGWMDGSTKKQTGTAINFEPDGHGRYIGQLYHEPFAKHTLDQDGDRICTPFEIIVKDDVSRGNDIAKQHGIKEYKNEHWRTQMMDRSPRRSVPNFRDRVGGGSVNIIVMP